MPVALLDYADAEEPLCDLPNALYLLPHEPPGALDPDYVPPEDVVADDHPLKHLGVVAVVHVHHVYAAVLSLGGLRCNPEGAVVLLRDEQHVTLLDPRLLRPVHGDGDGESRVPNFLYLSRLQVFHLTSDHRCQWTVSCESPLDSFYSGNL